jgi:hypothetical protein
MVLLLVRVISRSVKSIKLHRVNSYVGKFKTQVRQEVKLGGFKVDLLGQG